MDTIRICIQYVFGVSVGRGGGKKKNGEARWEARPVTLNCSNKFSAWSIIFCTLGGLGCLIFAMQEF